MIVVDTVEDDVNNVGQQVSHDGKGGVGGDELFYYVEDLGLAAGEDVHL